MRYRPDIVIAHTVGPIVQALSPEVLLMDVVQGSSLVAMVNRRNENALVIAAHMRPAALS